jgi:hypothetical protein
MSATGHYRTLPTLFLKRQVEVPVGPFSANTREDRGSFNRPVVACGHNAKPDYGNRVVEFDQLVGVGRNGWRCVEAPP